MPESDPRSNATLGIIRIAGEDAASFLRAQLTNDVLRLGPDRHFLAAWCDAKGRTVMVCRVVDIGDAYLLIMPASLIEPMTARLRMYVLRARVELTNAGADYAIAGTIGDDLPAPNCTETRRECVYLGLPIGMQSPARALALWPPDQPAPENTVGTDSDDWRLTDIDAGLPWIESATQGEFVPQMLNLHWLMAVDFDKGCYPGQEVVARLHYRGRLTRRLFRLRWSGQHPVAGDRLADRRGDTIGTVVQAAASSVDTGRALAVLAVDRAGYDTPHTDHAELSLLDLPYPTPD